MPMPEPITLQRAAVCADCGATLAVGEKARWYAKSQKAYCAGPHAGGPGPAPGLPGGEDLPSDSVPFVTEQGAEEAWGYEQKDRLMCRESCIKSAVAIFAASIQAGIYKTHPDVTAPIAYAEALEKWCLEDL